MIYSSLLTIRQVLMHLEFVLLNAASQVIPRFTERVYT